MEGKAQQEGGGCAKRESLVRVESGNSQAHASLENTQNIKEILFSFSETYHTHTHIWTHVMQTKFYVFKLPPHHRAHAQIFTFFKPTVASEFGPSSFLSAMCLSLFSAAIT